MVLNAYAMSWFDFQNKCRLLGQELPSATHHQKPYWTKYYKRQSDWIGKYGCYKKADLAETEKFIMHLPSAGLCQEFCMENYKSNEFFFFGVQNRTCICLSMHPTVSSKPLNQCEFACFENNVLNEFLKCGGSSVYNVFVSKKDGPKIICNDSNANCNHKEDQIQIYKDETKCNSVNENYREKCNINLTTQVYTSFDRGKELSISFKTNILFCQQCTEKRCSFKKCTSRINNTNCAQSELSTAHPSVLKSITQTAVPNVTEKRVSLMWITFYKLVSRYTKQAILHDANVSMTIQPTPKENTNNSMAFIVGGLASSTVICFLFLMVAIYFIRYEHTSIGKLNPQNKQTNQNVTGASYYELADNSKLIETYPNNKDNNKPYYEIKEPISGIDTYMVASYKMLDVESVNFDRKKGSYDHLKKTSRIRHEENTYDHAENINTSSYSCLGAARNWNDRHIDNDMYDHI
uniref:WSC domain-containing protein n=1 Tax=Magallana gigas TaxID=29159 RepID=A0A8W8LXR6_MAGGI